MPWARLTPKEAVAVLKGFVQAGVEHRGVAESVCRLVAHRRGFLSQSEGCAVVHLLGRMSLLCGGAWHGQEHDVRRVVDGVLLRRPTGSGEVDTLLAGLVRLTPPADPARWRAVFAHYERVLLAEAFLVEWMPAAQLARVAQSYHASGALSPRLCRVLAAEMARRPAVSADGMVPGETGRTCVSVLLGAAARLRDAESVELLLERFRGGGGGGGGGGTATLHASTLIGLFQCLRVVPGGGAERAAATAGLAAVDAAALSLPTLCRLFKAAAEVVGAQAGVDAVLTEVEARLRIDAEATESVLERVAAAAEVPSAAARLPSSGATATWVLGGGGGEAHAPEVEAPAPAPASVAAPAASAVSAARRLRAVCEQAREAGAAGAPGWTAALLSGLRPRRGLAGFAQERVARLAEVCAAGALLTPLEPSAAERARAHTRCLEVARLLCALGYLLPTLVVLVVERCPPANAVATLDVLARAGAPGAALYEEVLAHAGHSEGELSGAADADGLRARRAATLVRICVALVAVKPGVFGDEGDAPAQGLLKRAVHAAAAVDVESALERPTLPSLLLSLDKACAQPWGDAALGGGGGVRSRVAKAVSEDASTAEVKGARRVAKALKRAGEDPSRWEAVASAHLEGVGLVWEERRSGSQSKSSDGSWPDKADEDLGRLLREAAA